MNCPQCHKPLRDGAQFCTRCGSRTVHGRADSIEESVPTVGHAGADSTSPTIVESDPLVGRVLDGKYEIVSQLGTGGMGAVYLARRVLIGDEAAVKVLHAKFTGDETLVERFRREARAAAQLNHPNVVTIYDYGEARGPHGFAYIVMELVRGESLRDLLRREGKLEAGRAIALMRGVCAGVGAAHRRGIVHRDLKPDNVIVIPPDEDDPAERVKVVDFGLAKLRDMAAEATLTHVGAVVGTPHYMSPEQCKGEQLDARADVYSLGALLYEMLAGSPPFTAANMSGVILKHVNEPPPPVPQELRVPAALQEAIAHALSKDPDGRQRDAAEFARDIQAALSPATAKLNQQVTVQIFPATTQPAPVTPMPPAPATVTPATAASASPTPDAADTGHTAAPRRAAETHPQPFPQQTYTQAPPQQTYNAPPRKSRAPLVVGLLVLLLAGLGILGVAGLVYFGGRGGDGAVENISASPTPTPNVSNRNAARTNTNAANENTNGEETNTNAASTFADPATTRSEVASVLEGWAASLRERDIDSHMSYYADTLDTYYTRQNAPSSQVRSDRSRAFAHYDTMDVTLSDIQITPDPKGARAVATFNKAWDFESDSRHATGSVRQQLTLTNSGGRWLITGERDLKVFFTNNEEY